MTTDDYIRRAHEIEDTAIRRFGYYPSLNIPRLPTSYAAKVLQYWVGEVTRLVDSNESNEHPMVRQALATLKHWGTRPGRRLAPWAAEHFWHEQQTLAHLLFRLQPIEQRNAWIATPGTIAGEMETTKTVIDELAHTIHDRYRALYLDAHDAAFREFEQEHGRHAGTANVDAGEPTISADQKNRDMEEILERISAKTGVTTTLEHLKAKTYQPRFVRAWELFYQEWETWYQSNKGFWARMWGSKWEKAIEYRERAVKWRKRFESLDRERNRVESPLPPAAIDSWQKLGKNITTWLKWGAVAAGGVLLVPPVLRSLSGNQDD